jgi:3-oxoacyl-[acyl-carrier-protein] synthase III
VYEVPDPAKYVQEFMNKGISLPEIVERWSKFYFDICYRSLADADINSSDVAMIIPSNSDGRQFEQLLFDPLGIPASHSSVDFGRGIGHVGACDQMISLEHFMSVGRLSPGDYVLLVSSGPGITSNSIVLRITDAPAVASR